MTLSAEAISETMALHTSSVACRTGLLKTNFDHSIFMNKTGSIIINAFVDNLVSVYSNEKEETEHCRHLKTRFQMTGRDPINWMVDINIMFPSENIRLPQIAHLERVLEHFGMKECPPLSTPLEPVPDDTSRGSHRDH